jgi:uroporphyrinogen decarboxylase
MNERERYLATLLFGTPDKVPLQPGGPRESTLAAWRRQGLPADVPWYEHLMHTLGIPYMPPTGRLEPGVSFQMIPIFEEKVLERHGNTQIVQDWMGSRVQISTDYDYTYLRTAKDFVTRKWLSSPVQTRQDWEEKMKWRYDPRDPQRFPADFAQRCERLRDRDYVVNLTLSGPFWQLREWCGFEGLCILMVEQPDFVHEMIDFWQGFVSETLALVLAQMTPDYVMINEDMAYKAHSMISPRMVRRFLMPTWKRWNEQLRAAGCPVLGLDSDGYVAELLPLWIEAGFNMTFPIEVAAGNDIVAYRRQYGRQMAYLGAIDKRAMAAGGDVMRAEVLRVVPPLLKDGGLIPGCDHGVPSDISWPNYVEFARLVAQLTGWL